MLSSDTFVWTGRFIRNPDIFATPSPPPPPPSPPKRLAHHLSKGKSSVGKLIWANKRWLVCTERGKHRLIDLLAKSSLHRLTRDAHCSCQKSFQALSREIVCCPNEMKPRTRIRTLQMLSTTKSRNWYIIIFIGLLSVLTKTLILDIFGSK